jgi:glycosyltransferase involved in cell wall biosynthesis
VRKEVNALREEGHTVDVICLRESNRAEHEIWNGVSIHRLPVRHQRRGLFHYLYEYLCFFLRVLMRLSRLQLRHRYDLIQIHNLPDFLVFAALLPRLQGAKIVLDMHEPMPEFFASRFQFWGASWLMQIVAGMQKLSAWFAHQLMVVSPVDAALLKKRVRKSALIVHNVPDESIFAEVPPNASADGLARHTLMTHGTLVERYGVQIILRALPKVLAKYPESQLYVVGDGEFLRELKQEALQLGLEKQVHFTGRIALEKIPGYLSCATIGIVPLLEDGFIELASPNKLFEYVALKKPVLAADVPGIRAYFDDRQLEFFRPGDADDLGQKIIALLDSPGRRTRLTGEAWKVYETVRWNHTKKEYQQMIRDLLAGRSKEGVKCQSSQVGDVQ